MSNIKGNALVSYDIPHSHEAVKQSMLKKGYRDRWNYEGNKTVYLLPNTTLWKPNTSSDDAMADLKASCSACSVALDKAVAVLATDWVGYNKQ